MYYWQEHYLLPFSHDENVHGKATILQKMWGDYETKFPQGRMLYAYMMLHPGKKLDFMCNEFGQLREWDESRAQDWELVRYPVHDAFLAFRTALQKLYLKYDCLWERDYAPGGFDWVDLTHAAKGTFAFSRMGSTSRILAVFNFIDLPVRHHALPAAGKFTLLLDTDWTEFGGITPRPQKKTVRHPKAHFAPNLAPYSAQLWLWEENPKI